MLAWEWDNMGDEWWDDFGGRRCPWSIVGPGVDRFPIEAISAYHASENYGDTFDEDPLMTREAVDIVRREWLLAELDAKRKAAKDG